MDRREEPHHLTLCQMPERRNARAVRGKPFAAPIPPRETTASERYLDPVELMAVTRRLRCPTVFPRSDIVHHFWIDGGEAIAMQLRYCSRVQYACGRRHVGGCYHYHRRLWAYTCFHRDTRFLVMIMTLSSAPSEELRRQIMRIIFLRP